ncbi:MAG: SDR family NAD(P)-dependent oxidoreductase [Acidimicrobiaceae bacterium]|nr:SDR family NAD(P)-dependent oxidoreductase [Acidimicrobiaceae bacterium]
MATRKWALITGASSGIGRQFAITLAKNGYDIVAVARRRELLETLSVEVSVFGRETKIVVADLSTSSGVESVVDAARKVDFLVLNAGVTRAARVGTTNVDEIEKLNMLLATGVVQVCEAILPEMMKRKTGDVVIVSSIAAFTPMPKSALYAAAKTYVMSYGRSMNLEVRDSGVRVCVVCPGYVRTDIHEKAGLAHLRERVPNFLWVDASDVVTSAQRGLKKNKSVMIPGLVYRLARPFLGLGLAQKIWRRTTSRS